MDSTEAKLLKKTLSDYTGEITASAIHSFNTRHSFISHAKSCEKEMEICKAQAKKTEVCWIQASIP